jgi:hypothetical protein
MDRMWPPPGAKLLLRESVGTILTVSPLPRRRHDRHQLARAQVFQSSFDVVVGRDHVHLRRMGDQRPGRIISQGQSWNPR